jgi:hypothetical protein
MNVNKTLKPKRIKSKFLLLDANNPRLYNIHLKMVSAKDMLKKEIQMRTRNYMDRYSISQLSDSIRVTGFNSVDRMVVVRAFSGSDYYIVIEGNRRLAAIFKLLNEYEQGLPIEEHVLDSILEIDVLVIDGEDTHYENTSAPQVMIQALKHISGVKPWSPIAQARALQSLIIEFDYTPSEAAKAVGMSRNKANVRRRALCAFNDMISDEGIVIRESIVDLEEYFSYFEELYKDKNLREFYEWSDIEKKYLKVEELHLFYHWIGLIEDGNESKQIPGALDVRLLFRVMNHPEAYTAFKNGMSISNAHAIVLRDESEPTINYSRQIKKINKDLERLPSKYLRSISKEDMKILQSILTTVKEHLGDINGYI